MEWIAIEDEKPKDGQWVLVSGKTMLSQKQKTHYARYEDFKDCFFTKTEIDECMSMYTSKLHDVTHWMPLPEPPM